MDRKAVRERLEEFGRIRSDAGPDPVALAEAALFVEETFNVCLSDGEIIEENLGSHRRIEKFVSGKLNLKE